MKRIILMLLLYCYTAESFANTDRTPVDTLITDTTFAPANMDLRPYINVLTDDNQHLTVAQVSQLPFTHQDKLFHSNPKNNGRVNNCWLRLTVKNHNNTAISCQLFSGWHDYMYWYMQAPGDTPQLLMQTGLMLDNGGVERWNHYAFNVNVPPGGVRTFYLHIIN
ncbi:7TM-DISM domain-containing protein, partial [Chitinophaga sp.]|uniref:7TM-DISM domain-containing protein n=1 Tax=Chitinophaga sp. TaxID=1869181 RepID=UPI002F939665